MASGGRSLLKTSEERFDFVCTACERKGKRVEAVKYCLECCGYCCQSCTDVHTMFPALENHNLMEVNQASGQSSSLPEFPTERCNKHKGKVLDMYCEGHDAVGCSTCFFEDHRSCPDSHFYSIPDMIDTIFKLSDCKHTQKILKDMVASMETVSKSKDAQLQMLDKIEKTAQDKVTTFQKALEAIVKKASDASRREIKDVCKDMNTDILQDKHSADNICEDLKTTDDKLDQSEGNRAQQFVCYKVGEEKIKEAEVQKKKQELQRDISVQLSFIPDQALMEYVQGLQGIGIVKKHETGKVGVYKIKGTRDIATDHDHHRCCVTANHLLVTYCRTKKLKRFDLHTMSVVDSCTLNDTPVCVCCISKQEVAVACQVNNKIQFVSIQGKMSPTRQIQMSHECYGIAFNDGKLYVTDVCWSLYVYDMTGTRLKKITQDNAGSKLFSNSRHITFNESGDRMFVGDGENGVVCFDGSGNYMSTITDSGLDFADGVCVDGRGSVFVAGWSSNNVVQYSENGEKVGVVVKQGDGLFCPYSVCFHKGLNRMYVTMTDSSVLKMYELE